MLAADGTPQEVVNRREMESLYDMKLLIRNNPLLEKPEIVPIRVMNEKPIVADIPFGTGNIRNLDGLENIKGKLYIYENIVNRDFTGGRLKERLDEIQKRKEVHFY